MKRVVLLLVCALSACRKPETSAASDPPPMTVTFTRPANAVNTTLDASLSAPIATRAMPDASVAPLGAAGIVAGVTRVGPLEYDIDRTVFKPDPTWTTSARIVPELSGAKVRGLRVTFPSGHALEQLGVASGDVISQVNGMDFEAFSRSLSTHALSAITDVVLTVERGGRTVSLTYHVRAGGSGLRALGGLLPPF